jgi:peptide/nickel transport system ATP-binding protein
VLIADEPVAGLDASAQSEILALLLGLRGDTGLSVLLVTHDLAAAWQVADRIAVMRHGRILETGLAEHIVRAPAHPYTRALLDAGRGGAADPGRA